MKKEKRDVVESCENLEFFPPDVNNYKNFMSKNSSFLINFLPQVATMCNASLGGVTWGPPGSAHTPEVATNLMDRDCTSEWRLSESNVPKRHTISQSWRLQMKLLRATLFAPLWFFSRARRCCQAIIDGPWCDVSDGDGRQVFFERASVSPSLVEASPAAHLPQQDSAGNKRTGPCRRTRGPVPRPSSLTKTHTAFRRIIFSNISLRTIYSCASFFLWLWAHFHNFSIYCFTWFRGCDVRVAGFVDGLADRLCFIVSGWLIDRAKWRAASGKLAHFSQGWCLETFRDMGIHKLTHVLLT